MAIEESEWFYTPFTKNMSNCPGQGLKRPVLPVPMFRLSDRSLRFNGPFLRIDLGDSLHTRPLPTMPRSQAAAWLGGVSRRRCCGVEGSYRRGRMSLKERGYQRLTYSKDRVARKDTEQCWLMDPTAWTSSHALADRS